MTPVASTSLAAAGASRPPEALKAQAARRAERCEHDACVESRGDDTSRGEGARRSPLLKALVQALREVLAAPASVPGSADTASTPAAPAAAAAPKTPDAEAAAAAPKSTDAGGDALEQALTAFARALVQALRGDGGEREIHGRGHHYGHGRGLGWGDPAQRIEKLAGQVAQGAGTEPAPSAPATSPTAPVPPAAPDTAASPATGTTAGSAAAPAAATLVVEIRLVPAGTAASPWARAGDELVSAFGALQQALGRSSTTPAGESSVRDQLAAFLRDLAARVRGDAAAMAEPEPTRPGTLLSVTA